VIGYNIDDLTKIIYEMLKKHGPTMYRLRITEVAFFLVTLLSFACLFVCLFFLLLYFRDVTVGLVMLFLS
jgi:hypothetical protein